MLVFGTGECIDDCGRTNQETSTSLWGDHLVIVFLDWTYHTILVYAN